jgi:hypothetical protein
MWLLCAIRGILSDGGKTLLKITRPFVKNIEEYRNDIKHIIPMHASVRSTDNIGPNTNEHEIRHKMLV